MGKLKPHIFPRNLKYTFLPFNDYPNANGRIYNKDSFINFTEISQKVKDGKCFGKIADVPYSTDETDFNRISHKVTSVKITEKGLEGTITILETPRGELVKNMIDCLVIRPKMYLGTQDENGLTSVEIYSFDFIDEKYDGFNFNKRVMLSKLKKKNSYRNLS